MLRRLPSERLPRRASSRDIRYAYDVAAHARDAAEIVFTPRALRRYPPRRSMPPLNVDVALLPRFVDAHAMVCLRSASRNMAYAR